MTQEEIKKKIIEALDTDTYSEHMGRQRAIEQIEALTAQVRKETLEGLSDELGDINPPEDANDYFARGFLEGVDEAHRLARAKLVLNSLSPTQSKEEEGKE